MPDSNNKDLSNEIPVGEWASRHGLKISSVFNLIDSEKISAVHRDGRWYIKDELSASAIKKLSGYKKSHNTILLSAKTSIKKWIFPKYDDVTLFIMSSSALLLIIIDQDFRDTLIYYLIDRNDPRTIFITFMLLSGLVLCFIQGLFDHRKSEFERWLMLAFAVFYQGLTGIVAGIYVIDHSVNLWYTIFPIVNIINSIILLVLFRSGKIDVDSIVDSNTNRKEMLIVFVITLGFVSACHYLYDMHWSVLLSMCIVLSGYLSLVIDSSVNNISLDDV